jgi:hypothetical protein
LAQAVGGGSKVQWRKDKEIDGNANGHSGAHLDELAEGKGVRIASAHQEHQ